MMFLSKLSYSTYLIHIILLIQYYGSQRSLVYFTKLNMFNVYLSLGCSVIFFSFRIFGKRKLLGQSNRPILADYINLSISANL